MQNTSKWFGNPLFVNTIFWCGRITNLQSVKLTSRMIICFYFSGNIIESELQSMPTAGPKQDVWAISTDSAARGTFMTYLVYHLLRGCREITFCTNLSWKSFLFTRLIFEYNKHEADMLYIPPNRIRGL